MTQETQTLSLPLMASDDDAARTREHQRQVRRWIKRTGLLVMAGLLVLLTIRALLPDPVAVEVAPIREGPMRVTVDETGRTRVKTRYVVSAPLGGRLSRIDLRPGDPVAAQAPVASITPRPAPLLDARTRAEAGASFAAARFAERQSQATLARARTALEHARREADRARALGAGGAITPAAVDEATFALRARTDELAVAELGARVAAEEARRARVVLQGRSGTSAPEVHQVLSPVAGRVLRVLQESEAVVEAGAPLLEVGDPAGLEVVVDVLTADAVGITPGAPVSIEAWGGQEPLTGRVRAVEPAAFTRLSALGVEEQRVNVLVDLDGPPDRWASLGDGFRVEARILAWHTPRAVLVPLAATIRAGEGWAVFLVEGGRARLRPVKVGHRNAQELELLSGVSPGDRVVLYPGDRLADDRTIRERVQH